MKTKRLLSWLIIATMIFSFGIIAGSGETITTEIYVAVDGNNSNEGTVESPLATIEGAREKIRKIKKNSGLPVGGITVYVQNGTYKIDNQIDFTEEDSGTVDSPIVYKAWGEGKTSLLGGYEISGKNFSKITDTNPNYERLQTDDAKANVKVYNLNDLLTPEELSGKIVYKDNEYDPWEIGGRGAYGSAIPGIEVFYNDEAMDAARWPNRDTDGKNKFEVFGDLITAVEKNGITEPGPVFKYNDARVEKYKTTKYASIVNISGYWSERSSFEVDKTNKQISIDHAGEQLVHWADNTTYFYEHIFEELDCEGEYYVDYDKGLLYVYGYDDIDSATIKVSTFGKTANDALLRLNKTSNITFDGFDIGLTRSHGIHITSGTNVTIINCNIFATGLAGIADGTIYGGYSTPYMRGRGIGVYKYSNISYPNCTKEEYQANAGYNHNYVNNHIYNTGIHGIVVSAGDRIDLDPANHLIYNNEIHNTGEFEQSFGSGVEANGVGVNIIGNTIHDIPLTAIRFATNDSVIEYNDIYNCMNEGSDMGVLYSAAWDASICAGTEIRYNYIHDVENEIVSSGTAGNTNTLGLTTPVAWRIGIYSDDGKPFLDMHHNVFENMPVGIEFHGGAEHNANDNIFINVRKPLNDVWDVDDHIKPTDDETVNLWNSFCGKEYEILDNSAWRAKHPEVFKVRDELELRPQTANIGGHDVKGNYCVYYTNPEDCIEPTSFNKKFVRYENNTFTKSIEGFKDIANGDYSFAENSKIFETHPNLKSIDLNKIGRKENRVFNPSAIKLESISADPDAITLNYNAEIPNGTFTLTTGEYSVEAQVSKTDDKKTVTIAPKNGFDLDKIYVLRVKGVSDEHGRTINGYYQAFKLQTEGNGYKFVTVDEIPVAPELEKISATTDEVTLDYSEAISGGNFTLTLNGSPIAVSVSKGNTDKTVVITPNVPLKPNAVYTVCAKDISDNSGGVIHEYNQMFMLSLSDTGYRFIKLSEIPVAPELENVSATKSGVTLDYSEEVPGGTFTLTQNGNPVETTFTIENKKTVVITPENGELSLDTIYEVHASNIPDYKGGAIPAYSKTFKLEKLFEDDFDNYNAISDMNSKWNVGYANTSTNFGSSVSNYNEGNNIYELVSDDKGGKKLIIGGDGTNATLNIKSNDVSKWNKYTLEFDVGYGDGMEKYWFDVFYHMKRGTNGYPTDSGNSLRMGLYVNNGATWYYEGDASKPTTANTFDGSDHIKLTTKTGKDFYVFNNNVNILSDNSRTTPFTDGEIGFRVINGDSSKKYYIDNVVAYKFVELDIKISVEANKTSTGVSGTYEIDKYEEASIDNSTVIVAAYGNSNQLLGVPYVTSVKDGDGNFSIVCSNEVSYVKVYLWDSLSGMKPIAPSNSVTVK